jgi:DNA-binding transcriptional ArsR family regulator
MNENILEKWASIFVTIGNPVRLAVLLILQGSRYLRGEHSLKFTEIQSILEMPSEASLTYHLNRLLDSGLIEKMAHKDENERVYPLYSVSQKWLDFTKEVGLAETFDEYIEKLR